MYCNSIIMATYIFVGLSRDDKSISNEKERYYKKDTIHSDLQIPKIYALLGFLKVQAATTLGMGVRIKYEGSHNFQQGFKFKNRYITKTSIYLLNQVACVWLSVQYQKFVSTQSSLTKLVSFESTGGRVCSPKFLRTGAYIVTYFRPFP